MKLKAALKYQIHEFIRPLIIFYIVVYALLIYMGIQQAIMAERGLTVEFSGLEMASGIFIFIVGLNSFKTTFQLFLANGVSRKTMFKSYLGAVAPLAALMALVDSINSLVLSSVGNFHSMFYQVYSVRYGEISTFGAKMQVFWEGFVWMTLLYVMIAMTGFFLTTIYYRMGKSLKLIVSVGVPVLLVIILPYIDSNILDGAISKAMDHFFRIVWGMNDRNPYIAVLTCFVTFAVFSGFSFLTMRRATVKE